MYLRRVIILFVPGLPSKPPNVIMIKQTEKKNNFVNKDIDTSYRSSNTSRPVKLDLISCFK